MVEICLCDIENCKEEASFSLEYYKGHWSGNVIIDLCPEHHKKLVQTIGQLKRGEK
jgi:hypothetical protein